MAASKNGPRGFTHGGTAARHKHLIPAFEPGLPPCIMPSRRALWHVAAPPFNRMRPYLHSGTFQTANTDEMITATPLIKTTPITSKSYSDLPKQKKVFGQRRAARCDDAREPWPPRPGLALQAHHNRSCS